MEYCNDPDATFPTPIILSIDLKNDNIANINRSKIDDEIVEFNYNDEEVFAEILDGQHRVEGIKRSKSKDFELPIVIMFDLTEEEKAYVFSTINSNQTKVDKSLIYDLFELSTKRSPYKTCHEIARIMNSSPKSPFYRKLKMLGKKASDKESLSQGTFVTYLCSLISKEPKDDMIKLKNEKLINYDDNYPLRKYFIDNQDEIILKILENYFIAVQEVFKEEWENPDKYILSKTLGYGALIKAFKKIYTEGKMNKDLTKEYFAKKFINSKRFLMDNEIELTSQYFSSSEQKMNELASLFILTSEQKD